MIYPRPLCQHPLSVMEEGDNSGCALTSPAHPSLTPYKATAFPRITVFARSQTSQTKHFHTSKYVIYFFLTKSGLTAAVKASKINLSKAEDTFLDFIKKHTSAKECPLAGNSVHADKKFLDKHMPRFMNHLHYRIVDVSSIKELCR